MSRDFGNRLLAKVKTKNTPPAKMQEGSGFSTKDGFVCRVYGLPQTQGGVVPFKNKHTGRVNQITVGSKTLPEWRKQMTRAFNNIEHTQFHGPVEVYLLFIINRNSKHPKVKGQGRFWPDRTKDLDKLSRAVGDSLTNAEVYRDDSDTCIMLSTKRYAAIGESPGVLVIVKPIIKQQDHGIFDYFRGAYNGNNASDSEGVPQTQEDGS